MCEAIFVFSSKDRNLVHLLQLQWPTLLLQLRHLTGSKQLQLTTNQQLQLTISNRLQLMTSNLLQPSTAPLLRLHQCRAVVGLTSQSVTPRNLHLHSVISHWANLCLLINDHQCTTSSRHTSSCHINGALCTNSATQQVLCASCSAILCFFICLVF